MRLSKTHYVNNIRSDVNRCFQTYCQIKSLQIKSDAEYSVINKFLDINLLVKYLDKHFGIENYLYDREGKLIKVY